MRVPVPYLVRVTSLLAVAAMLGVADQASWAQGSSNNGGNGGGGGGGTIGLSIASPTVTFLDESPDQFPQVEAAENPIRISVNLRGPYQSSNWILTLSANGDLESGTSRIPINHITWRADGNNFRSGTLRRSHPVEVGSGVESSTGTITFRLRNSWDFPSGNYSQSLVYTLVVL